MANIDMFRKKLAINNVLEKRSSVLTIPCKTKLNKVNVSKKILNVTVLIPVETIAKMECSLKFENM